MKGKGSIAYWFLKYFILIIFGKSKFIVVDVSLVGNPFNGDKTPMWSL